MWIAVIRGRCVALRMLPLIISSLMPVMNHFDVFCLWSINHRYGEPLLETMHFLLKAEGIKNIGAVIAVRI